MVTVLVFLAAMPKLLASGPAGWITVADHGTFTAGAEIVPGTFVM